MTSAMARIGTPSSAPTALLTVASTATRHGADAGGGDRSCMATTTDKCSLARVALPKWTTNLNSDQRLADADLHLGKAVSNDDCDALASHTRNRLQSDRDDRCQDGRRHFPFVAHAGVSIRLPL